MFSDATLAEALSPRILSLILLPTEKCNFRCTYCYEDFAIGRMQQPIVEGIKRLISRRVSSLDRLSLSWFGGEPLLAKDVVIDIGTYAYELCRENGVSFQSGFTTNGYLLTPELLNRFVGISHNEYQITLDGDDEWHDKTRVMANRKPTFEKIWKNLVSYRQCQGDFRISLRLHLHRENIESVRRLYALITSTLLHDPRFGIYFHKVSNLDAASSIQEEVLGREEYLDAINYIVGSESQLQPPGKAISEEHLEGYICYASKPNSLMIRADGRIGKCTVALNDDRNNIGRIREDGTLHVANEKLRPWLSGFSDLSERALGCPLSVLA